MKILILIALLISTSCVMYGQGQIARPKKTVPVKTAPIKADSKKSKANSRQKQQKSENVSVDAIGLDSLQDQVVILQSEPEVVLSPEEMCAKGKEEEQHQRYNEALQWYFKAAEQGDIKSQYILGEIYSGLKYAYIDVIRLNSNFKSAPDTDEAIKWFRLGAEQGDTSCQRELAVRYDRDKKYDEALEWYFKAAEQGDMESQRELGNYYTWEDSKEKNYEQGLMWYRKAGDQGDIISQRRLKYMYRRGQGVSHPYSELEWYETAAEWGHSEAQYMLGMAYFSQEGTDIVPGLKRNYTEAFKWFQKAAEQGYPQAKTNLGYLYYTGMGGIMDQNKARELWEDAANEDGAAKEYLNKYFK